jgi:hypothetical protein
MSNFLKTLKTQGILVPHIENYFAAGKFRKSIMLEINPDKEHDTAFHPSSDALACAIEIYASKLGLVPKSKHTAETQKTFQIGHMFHAWIQDIVCHSLGFVEEEGIEREFRAMLDGTILDCNEDWREDSRLVNGNWMRGHVDLVPVEIPGQAAPWLVDIKTAHDYAFQSVGLNTGLWLKYEAQVQLYMDWTQTEQTIVLYAEKDKPGSHAFKERIVKYDPGVAESIYEKWETVRDALADGTPPECTCGNEGCKGKVYLKAAEAVA